MRTVFRLFVSSTFNDFREERKLLQEDVFPQIEKYCLSKNASFQPIDLRWGVSSEAQLDQQTLELCLNEVKLCKAKPYPNFLVMLGERYGWIPLPFMIEKNEYESMFLHVKDEKQKELLNRWYILDENQIPASYRLQEREGEFAKWEVWEKSENALRDILQDLAKKHLDEKSQEKYFTSATEAEIIEGVLPYKETTPFQEKLLKSTSKEKDAQNIFAFYRNINEQTKQEGIFVEDNPKLKSLKQELKSHLSKDNLLEANIQQTQKDKLDTSYLEEFKERLLEFLKQRVDLHVRTQSQENLNEDELERQEQSYYKSIKLKNFLHTHEIDEALTKIDTYIKDENSTTPLVIYGKSGSGKSALMAKAIQTQEESLRDNTKLLYTFVGATPNSTSTKEVLYGIFKNFGVSLLEKQESKDLLQSINSQEKQESYEDFCYRVQDEFLKLSQKDEKILIFLDALDQCEGDKEPLWLPTCLPKNVKVVISALKDENYEEDSKVFTHLSALNARELKNFSKPQELLNLLLEEENRKVTDEQCNYFLARYQNAQTPFYILLASSEMKKWKSYQREYKLESSNKEIVKEYISNLTKLYHHDGAFVQKVLCFLLSSRYGLSENEILSLMNVIIKHNLDENFTQSVAPETFHENVSKELPLVHWSRLLSFLSSFLKKSKKDGEELMSFFHREFEDALHVSYKDELIKESESMLKAMSYKLKEVQNQDFDSNRWGKLYGIALCEYDILFKNEDSAQNKLEEFCKEVLKFKDEWNDVFLFYLLENGFFYGKQNHMYEAIGFEKSVYFSSKSLYKKNSDKWAEAYTSSLNNLGNSYYKINKTNEAIELFKQTLKITNVLYSQNPQRWAEAYTKSLNNLGSSYKQIGKTNEAIELLEQALKINKELYKQNPQRWAEAYTKSLNNLGSSYEKIGKTNEAIELEEQALKINKELYKQNPQRWAEDYTMSLINLASSYKQIGKISEAIELEEQALKIRNVLYKKNPDKWAEAYTISLNNLGNSYYNIGKTNEAIELLEQALKINKELYKQNPQRWAEDYTSFLNNLGSSYKQIGKTNEAIEVYEQVVEITNVLYKKNPDK